MSDEIFTADAKSDILMRIGAVVNHDIVELIEADCNTELDKDQVTSVFSACAPWLIKHYEFVEKIVTEAVNDEFDTLDGAKIMDSGSYEEFLDNAENRAADCIVLLFSSRMKKVAISALRK